MCQNNFSRVSWGNKKHKKTLNGNNLSGLEWKHLTCGGRKFEELHRTSTAESICIHIAFGLVMHMHDGPTQPEF
jgi:hypothetical protein